MHRRQQLGHAGFAHRQIGKKQMVVDHDHIRCQRVTPGHVDMALPEMLARAPQAVFARRGHQRNGRRALVQPFKLGQIARVRRLGKTFDASEDMQQGSVRAQHAVPGLLQAVQAEIAAPSFQQGKSQGQTEQLGQIRQIAREKLILQGFGCRGHQHALTRQQRRHQIGKRFANPCAGLDNQRLMPCNRACHSQCHAQLAAALTVMRITQGQRTSGCKKVDDLLFQCAPGRCVYRSAIDLLLPVRHQLAEG